MESRVISVRRSDKLLVSSREISGEMLSLLLQPNQRLLWAFVEKEGVVQAVPYNEERVIWLDKPDLEEADASQKKQS
jgi:hypothetical protein